MDKIDVRLVPPVLISLILVAGHYSFGILRGFESILLAIGTAVVVELAAGRLMYDSWPHPASAYTSGISVGILVRAPMLWPFALCSALSILSKYVLRVKGRHLWNPSNFGLCVLFFPAAYGLLDIAPLNTQWGNSMWPMLVIWIVGLYTIWKVKRFHITATYIGAFVGLSLVRGIITGDGFWTEVAPLTGPMYQLFALFMITDPVTTVSSKKGEVGVTILIAIAEFFLRLAEFIAAPFYALFLVGPAAMLVELHWTKDVDEPESNRKADMVNNETPVSDLEQSNPDQRAAPTPAS
ncbi:Na+-translocating ferredoxin:NAD+ oxidoreductase RnfD subunit [Salinibacter ruber]|nr:Na+-translocating ferredoxin:NAD+ oxidoreductase RnfD subunit [Salinibacter ruber]